MNLETSSELLLTKEQLQNILGELTAGYITSAEPPITTTPILPPFKKLGVLVDFDEIAEAKESKVPTYKSIVNVKTTQSQYYSCIQCRRQLPTAHLLDLHITEQHDLYFAASVERGDKPLYACYIEECTMKFYMPSERKDHCITLHKFPVNYRFDQEKATKSKNRKKKDANAMDVDVAVDSVPSSNEGKLPYIKAFSFGHPTQRTFNTRKERGSDKALNDVQAMKEALEDMD
ncbi:protein lethal(2)k10201 [Drosophila montana]|uniref:protein lethal(2)k10201 n=1 Tax=Drosophila montana TaxID=40370 RepID=UPI00313BE17F